MSAPIGADKTAAAPERALSVIATRAARRASGPCAGPASDQDRFAGVEPTGSTRSAVERLTRRVSSTSLAPPGGGWRAPFGRRSGRLGRRRRIVSRASDTWIFMRRSGADAARSRGGVWPEPAEEPIDPRQHRPPVRAIAAFQLSGRCNRGGDRRRVGQRRAHGTARSMSPFADDCFPLELRALAVHAEVLPDAGARCACASVRIQSRGIPRTCTLTLPTSM